MDWNFFRKRWFLWVVVVLLLVLVYFCTHYYNRFVTLETLVLTDKAQIEAQLQMRKTLLINLAKTVVDYADHERGVFKYMADQRLKSLERTEYSGEEERGTNTVAEIEELRGKILEGTLDQLVALAENYPELKLSANFGKLMDALVEIEKGLLERRMAYNQDNNVYGTYIRQFPQKIFAFCYGFEEYPYVRVDEDVEQFDRVEY